MALSAAESRHRPEDTAPASSPVVPPVAVLFTAEDWQALKTSDVAYGCILPLTPAARAAMVDDGARTRVLDGRVWFNDVRYAEAMGWIKASRDALDADLAAAGLHDATRWLVVYIHQMVANAVYRLHLTLAGGGPWIVPVPGGLRSVDDADAAADALFAHMAREYGLAAAWYQYRPPPLPALFRQLRRLTVWLVRRGGIAYVTQRSAHPFGLTQALGAVSPPVRGYHLTRTQTGWREYLRLGRELLRAWMRRDQIQFRAVSIQHDASADAARSAIGRISDPVIRRGMAHAGAEIGALAGLIDGMVDDMADIVRGLRPDVFIAYEIADGFSAALADACGRAGVHRLISNHNSHAPAPTLEAAPGMEHFFITQYPPEMTGTFLMWTPQGAETARDLLPPERWPDIRPIRRAPLVDAAALDRSAPQRGIRRILHAGNSQRWLTFFPYLFETSDEYLDGLSDLIDAVGHVASAELVVRIKGKAEQREAILDSLLPPGDHWSVKTRRACPFEEDLARAHLMVSDMSSTIMVAIQSRVPVLLWGGTLRYRHLPARTVPPTRDDRAAVYSVDHAEQLTPMIAAILDAHAGLPLTDAEVAPYVWPESAPDVRRLAQAIADGDHCKAWDDWPAGTQNAPEARMVSAGDAA